MHAISLKPELNTAYTPDHARAALAWFAKICADQWQMPVEEQCILLGGIKLRTSHKWKKQALEHQPLELSHDIMERLSLLLGIYKALKLISPDGHLADAVTWFVKTNHNPLFLGLSMKDFAVQRGTIDALYTIRRYLDRARG